MGLDIKKVSCETVDRYNARYQRYGLDVRSLGWGSKDQQELRFLQTCEGPFDIKKYSVVDIGCGFADYLEFMRTVQKSESEYIGWDLNSTLLDEAKKKYHADAKATFHLRDLMQPDFSSSNDSPLADIAVMLGLLNFNLGDSSDNYRYSEMAIDRALSLVSKGIVVDFLSTYKTDAYPEEASIFYHDPSRILEYVFRNYDNVILKHNYAPIPQKEFMIFVEK